MSKCDIKNLEERFFKKNKTDDELLELYKDMSEYIKDETIPFSERRKLQVSYAEAVVMMCDGLIDFKKLEEKSK